MQAATKVRPTHLHPLTHPSTYNELIHPHMYIKQKKPIAAPLPKKEKKKGSSSSSSSVMVPHEISMKFGVFSFIGDRLESWEEEEKKGEEEEEEEERKKEAALSFSASGINKEKIVHPHARYEVRMMDLRIASQATEMVAEEKEEEEEEEEEDVAALSRSGPLPFNNEEAEEAAAEAAAAKQQFFPLPSPSSSRPTHPPFPLLQKSTLRTGLVTFSVCMTKPTQAECAKRNVASHLISEVQEPEQVCMRFCIASMLGETEQKANLPPPPPPPSSSSQGGEGKKKKPVVRVTMGEITGEEGLVLVGGKREEEEEEEEEERAFEGLQFLSFPSLTATIGEEKEDPASNATAALFSVVTGATASSSTGGGGGGGGSMEHRLPVGGSRPLPLMRDLMEAQAGVGYARVSMDLAIKGLQMGDLQKRTQASMKRFAESLAAGGGAQPPPPRRVSSSGGGGGGEAAAVGTSCSGSNPLPALSPLRRGMHMILNVGTMHVEVVLSNNNPRTKEEKGKEEEEEEEPYTAMAIVMEGCTMHMFEWHRRVAQGSLPLLPPGARVPSIMEMVIHAQTLTMSAIRGT